MKTFWILFIIVFFSLIGNSKLTAQLPSGWQHLEYCADTCTTPWSPIYNVVVTIPELPNCNIAVGGYMRICNGEVEIVIMGYYIYNTSQACIDDFNALTDQQKNNIQISLFNKMTELIFMQEYNSLPAHLKYQLQCGFGSKKYFKGFFASCNKSCFYYNPTNQQFSAEIINCSEFCCIIEKEICYNTTTNSMEINETWTNNVIGPESCFPPLIGTCFGSFGSTDCFPICDTE